MTERPGEMDERDVDERFASIVARWEAPAAEQPDTDEQATDDPPATAGGGGASAAVGDGRESEPDPADARGSDDATRGPDDGSAPAPAPEVVVLPASAWRPTSPDAAAAHLEEDHFEPPDVVLPPQEDIGFWGAVIGLVAGPLLLVYVAMVRPFHSTRWFVAAVLLTLVGFLLLVLRQPRHRDPADPDDGARV